MSTTLARRLRRVGLLPTTFKEVKYTELVRKVNKDDGSPLEVEVTKIKKVPIRHSEALTPEDRVLRQLDVRAACGIRSNEFRDRRNKARAEHRSKIRHSVVSKTPVVTKKAA